MNDERCWRTKDANREEKDALADADVCHGPAAALPVGAAAGSNEEQVTTTGD
jgi:hypothetical protein